MKKIILLSVLFSAAASAQTFEADGSPQFSGSIDTGYLGGGPVSITQNTDTSTITALNSVACPGDNDSYFRRFDLDGAHGIAGVLNVTDVDFGVETATGNAGSQGATLNLYSIPNASPLLLANLTQIGTAAVTINDGSAFIQNVAVTGAIDGSVSDLVVELFVPDFNNGTNFFIGSNAGGQSGPSFIMSAVCGATEPTDLATLGFPGMHQIMVVNGTLPPPPEPAVIPVNNWFALALLALMSLFVARRFFGRAAV